MKIEDMRIGMGVAIEPNDPDYADIGECVVVGLAIEPNEYNPKAERVKVKNARGFIWSFTPERIVALDGQTPTEVIK